MIGSILRGVIALLLFCVTPQVFAQTIPNRGDNSDRADAPAASGSAVPANAAIQVSAPSQKSTQQTATDTGFWHHWFERVTKTQAQQPHWITPLATTTPRLEEEFRSDIAWQEANNGIYAENYSLSKGLELIPSEHVELILSVPPYIVHNQPNVADGFGDPSFLVKYRLLSANEEHGNYILTAFLAATLPTGQDHVGMLAATITPTIAAGKGWGNFDVQTTVGVSFPVSDTNIIGRSVIWNTAFQYRVVRKLWPELEVNSTFFLDGPHSGMKQTFLTPGLVVGRFHLWQRLGVTVGTGVQIAVTQFHTNNHSWILSLRFPF